jgi:hypothetical protein
VAYSITLAATALHVFGVKPAVVEALVVLSILFVAVEIVHSYRGKSRLTARNFTFIAAALCIGWALTKVQKGLFAWARWAPPYAIVLCLRSGLSTGYMQICFS